MLEVVFVNPNMPHMKLLEHSTPCIDRNLVSVSKVKTCDLRAKDPIFWKLEEDVVNVREECELFSQGVFLGVCWLGLSILASPPIKRSFKQNSTTPQGVSYMEGF